MMRNAVGPEGVPVRIGLRNHQISALFGPKNAEFQSGAGPKKRRISVGTR